MSWACEIVTSENECVFVFVFVCSTKYAPSHFKRSFLSSVRLAILDDKDEPVLNVSQRLNTLARHFSIRAGNSMTESPEVAQITSHIMSIGVKLDVTFENAMDGERITLAVRGDKLHR